MVIAGRRAAWAVAVCMLVTACGRQEGPAADSGASSAAPEPIVIGAVFPLSAGAGRIGEMKKQGADLAVEHLNADGGVHGRPLKIVYVDSRNNTTEAQTGFKKLTSVDGATVVMSAMSGVSLALAPVADRQQVVLFANASHPELPKKSPFVFRNLPSTALCAGTIAETAARDLKLTKVAILYLNDDYGAEAERVFRERFESLGGEIVGSDSFERNATDVRGALQKLAGKQPEAWWIPGYGAALGLVLKQKTELKLDGMVLCDLGLVDQNVLDTAGPAADGVVVVTPRFDPADPRDEVQRFVADFEAEYQDSPSFDAAFQYDAVHLIAEAMLYAEDLTGPAIRDALAATSDFVGVCGPTTFDADGDAKMEVIVRLMADGRLQDLVPVGDAEPTRPPTDTTPTDEAGAE